MRLEFSIYRYNPDVDDAPRMQDYTLEAEEGRDMMLLQQVSRHAYKLGEPGAGGKPQGGAAPAPINLHPLRQARRDLPRQPPAHPHRRLPEKTQPKPN